MLGSAVDISSDSVFRENRAFPNSDDFNQPARGGAISVHSGCVLEISNSIVESNSANIGGAISVFDGSLEATAVDFKRNQAIGERDGSGVGGAVALEVSPDKIIPVLNTGTRFFHMIFEALECNFVRNVATLRGGPSPEKLPL